MKTTLSKIESEIPKLIKANIVPFLHSSPAIGKSSLAKQIANKYSLEVIDLRLTECDSSDLNGLPFFENEQAKFLPFNTFPLQGQELPKGKKGWLLLLDEFNSAMPSVQAAAYKLVLDRQVGQYKLHDKVAIIACGNLDTDNAITNTMSSALVSRFAHFFIELNHNDWQDWAVKNGISPMITGFLAFKPDCLYTFNPNSLEPYACPRTWEMVNKLDDPSMLLLASLLGDGVASEFMAFKKHYEELPNIKEILKEPNNYAVPSNLAIQWATLSMVISQLETNVPACVSYLKRFPKELHMVALREIKGRYKTQFIAKHKELIDWLTQLSRSIYNANK